MQWQYMCFHVCVCVHTTVVTNCSDSTQQTLLHTENVSGVYVQHLLHGCFLHQCLREFDYILIPVAAILQ